MRRLAALILCACSNGAQPVMEASAPEASADASDDVAPIEDVQAPDDVVEAGPPPVVYASTESALFRFDADARTLERVGDFSCASERVQDIAIDGAGVMYGVTLESLVRIDPMTAKCSRVAAGQYPRALGFTIAGTLDTTEVLVGYNGMQYLRIDTKTGAQSFVGALDGTKLMFPASASGDFASRKDGRAYLTVESPDPKLNDVLIEVDPKTGAGVLPVRATGKPSLQGLAVWKGSAYAFAASGRVYKIAISVTPTMTEVLVTDMDGGTIPVDASDEAGYGLAFTGAAVTTAAP